MARITIDRVGLFLMTVMEVLQGHPEGLAGREVLDEMERRVQLTEDEGGFYPSNPRENIARVSTRWWTVNLVKAGWMSKSKTTWTITDSGRQQLQLTPIPGQFARESQRRYNEWRRSGEDVDPDEVELKDEVEKVAGGLINIETAEEDTYAVIKTFLSGKDPFVFQDIIAALIAGMGYTVAWKAPPGPDGGFDILALQDPLGAKGSWVKVQVKRTTSSKVSAPTLREFMSKIGDGDTGVFIAFSGFTDDATREALAQQTRRVRLLDVEDVIDLWISHYDRLSESDRRMVPLRNIWFLDSLPE